MDSKKIMAIVLVVIIVVAAVGVVLVVNDKDDDSKTIQFTGGTSGCLQVYGNANNDFVIDDGDIDQINRIIADGTEWKTDYPFADANYDGIVDSKDVDFVKAIIDATPKSKAPAYMLCFNTDRPDGYVEEVQVPVTSAAFSFAATTLGALNTVGIVDEFVAVTKSASWSSYTEPLLTEKYMFLTDDAHSIGNASVRPDATLCANFIKGSDDPLSLYIFSNANTYDYYNIRPSLNSIGMSVVTINDSSADPLDFASGILALGFMFGTDDNGYLQRSIEAATWLYDLNEYLSDRIQDIEDGKVTKLNAVATSSKNHVSGPMSSNTTNLKYMGLGAALANYTSESKSNTLSYNPDTDQWLNNYDIDVQIALSSSITDDWNWFMKDKDMTKAPANLLDTVKTYKTLKNYENTICVSLSMPAPLRDIIVLEFAYPTLIESGTAQKYVSDFFVKFYGCDQSMFDGLKLYGTPADFGLLRGD